MLTAILAAIGPFDITSTIDLNVPVILALAVLVIALAFSLANVLNALQRTDRELDVGLKPPRFGTRARTQPVDRTTEALLATALARLEDLEQGLNALVEAADSELEQRGQSLALGSLQSVVAGLGARGCRGTSS